MCVCMDYIFLLLSYITKLFFSTYSSSRLTLFQTFPVFAKGLQKISLIHQMACLQAYLCKVQANLICRISAANWPLSVSTRAEICKLFWSAVICLFGGQVSWGWVFRKISVFMGSQEFFASLYILPLSCLSTNKQAHIMLWTQTRADTDMQKKRPNMPPGWNFTKTQKPTLLRCSAGEEERDVDANEEMKSEWTTFLSQLASAARTVVPAIGRPGVSYSNCLSIEHSYQTPLPHTPCLTYWITKFIEMLFSKETWSKHERWGIQFSWTQKHT